MAPEATQRPGLTCRDISQIVTDYLEGAMDASERARFEHHLSLCPDCVHYVDQMRATVSVLGRVPAQPIPAEIEQKLLERFRDWKSSTG
jgi:anti-sigma factor RsiW